MNDIFKEVFCYREWWVPCGHAVLLQFVAWEVMGPCIVLLPSFLHWFCFCALVCILKRHSCTVSYSGVTEILHAAGAVMTHCARPILQAVGLWHWPLKSLWKFIYFRKWHVKFQAVANWTTKCTFWHHFSFGFPKLDPSFFLDYNIEVNYCQWQ